MPCECTTPLPHVRPSGIVVCLECGGRIEIPMKKVERP